MVPFSTSRKRRVSGPDIPAGDPLDTSWDGVGAEDAGMMRAGLVEGSGDEAMLATAGVPSPGTLAGDMGSRTGDWSKGVDRFPSKLEVCWCVPDSGTG